jgi:site-specific recombinase XerC
VNEPEVFAARAADADIVAVLGACRSARDRLIVLLMARAGLRRGELLGLRRSDVHLLADSPAVTLYVPKTSSTSCDQAIFVDQATDASVFSDAVLVEVGRFG